MVATTDPVNVSNGPASTRPSTRPSSQPLNEESETVSLANLPNNNQIKGDINDLSRAAQLSKASSITDGYNGHARVRDFEVGSSSGRETKSDMEAPEFYGSYPKGTEYFDPMADPRWNTLSASQAHVRSLMTEDKDINYSAAVARKLRFQAALVLPLAGDLNATQEANLRRVASELYGLAKDHDKSLAIVVAAACQSKESLAHFRSIMSRVVINDQAIMTILPTEADAKSQSPSVYQKVMEFAEAAAKDGDRNLLQVLKGEAILTYSAAATTSTFDLKAQVKDFSAGLTEAIAGSIVGKHHPEKFFEILASKAYSADQWGRLIAEYDVQNPKAPFRIQLKLLDADFTGGDSHVMRHLEKLAEGSQAYNQRTTDAVLLYWAERNPSHGAEVKKELQAKYGPEDFKLLNGEMSAMAAKFGWK